MERYHDVALHGPECEKALAAIESQMDAWGLKLPGVVPLAAHFGLNRFYEIGETEFWIANEQKLGYCGKLLFLFDGQTCPYHYHKQKHETFFIVKGTIEMKMGEGELTMGQGDVLPMPPGMGHAFTGIGPALVLEVSMPSILRDNFFADKSIGDDGVI